MKIPPRVRTHSITSIASSTLIPLPTGRGSVTSLAEFVQIRKACDPRNDPMKTKHLRHAGFVLCVMSLLAPQFLFAQKPAAPSPKPFELTVDSIMRGPRLVGYPPTGVYWSQDSQRIYFRWKQADEPRLKETSLYVVNRDGTGLRRLSDDEAKQAPPATGELSKDKTMTVFTEEV